MKLSREAVVIIVIIIIALAISALIFWQASDSPAARSLFTNGDPGLSRFESEEALVRAFREHRDNQQNFLDSSEKTFALTAEEPTAAPAEGMGDTGLGGGSEFSQTNIQVAGVDEADIVKTDGKYVYALAQEGLQIIEAYPGEEAKLLSTTEYPDFYTNEMFVDDDRLLVFGSLSYNFDEEIGKPVSDELSVMPYYLDTMAVRLYDISDRSNPQLVKQAEFEGAYVTSRKIDDYVYFVVNTYPRFEEYTCADIVPWYRESADSAAGELEDFSPVAECSEVAYIEPIQAENFITVASLSMADPDEAVAKEVVVGSGQNVYASPENLYVAQSKWPTFYWYGDYDPSAETSVVTRFSLDKGRIEYQAAGEVPGHILNQFSMDEYDNYFRIATTIGEVWNTDTKSQNNIYILNQDMERVGGLEDLAPGESIYSARFMGERGYLVTFKKIDPLFVIDLSDHSNPQVLGKLKIPGYSDYLHPYDENHIIGVGKNTIEAEEDLKAERELDFSWHQGVKLAIFDVSDVANPIEMHKEIIGDRGTDTPVLYNHKAFLFDKARDLMVLPITLAEIQGEPSADNQYGDYVFQGAYVYNITLENGFDLRGRVTHYDDTSVFDKSGYYFEGDKDIVRSLYIDNILYTLSDFRLKLNSLDNLERIKAIDFPE